MIDASCLCGGCRWQAKGPMSPVVVCHCVRCRKDYGASFAAGGGVPEQGFRFEHGEDEIRRYESSAGMFRNSCLTCGSPTPGDPRDGHVFLPLGSVEDDPGVRPEAHIFTASRAPWQAIPDDVPHFEAFPPGYDAPVLPDDGRPQSEPGIVRGSCLCNEVAWELDGALDVMRNCHCSRCRRVRGTAHATNAFGTAEGFRWLRGEDEAISYSLPEAPRFRHTFCRGCGSSLPGVARRQNFLFVPAGSVDGDPGIAPSEHIFVGSKAPWFTIADDLPRHAEGVPSR